jgi:hypothetical protein
MTQGGRGSFLEATTIGRHCSMLTRMAHGRPDSLLEGITHGRNAVS